MRSYVVGLGGGLAVALVVAAGLAVGLNYIDDSGTAPVVQSERATATAIAPDPTATPTPAATPTPTPTLYVVDAAAELALARPEIEAALAGFDGDWGFHVIELASGAELGINESQNFYPASSGKIILAIAVLRQVEQGIREFQPIQDRYEQMMLISSDEAADDMDALVNENETLQVFRDSGASEASAFPGWRSGWVTPRDLALVWKALVDGMLLNEENTAYLLDLTGRYEMDPIFQTFPVRLNREGYLYGQKAGYNIQNFPHTFVGAGYTLSADFRYGFVAVLILRTDRTAGDTHDQRTRVYPILASHLLPPE
ncbi:MAG: serine hydrolase [Dehalococcoidia bacterium]